ncbi:MAG: GatB/YqeY domain-containing protein [Gammaproteobacteria bacterium]
MSDLKQLISDDVKTAMRNRDKQRVAVLRMIMAAIKQKEVDTRTELDDSRTLAILDRLVKQHRDSIEQFDHAGRDDLVEKEKRELEVVLEYMPSPLSDDEVTQLIQAAISESGASGMKDMGKVMGILKPGLQGRADMGKVSGLVKRQLGN